MNVTMVDVSHLPGAKISDEVVLLGKQKNNTIHVSSFTNYTQLLNNEMLSRLPTAIPRTFELLLGAGGGRRRQAAMALCGAVSVLWLAAPAYQHLRTAPAPRATLTPDQTVAAVAPEPDTAPKPQPPAPSDEPTPTD